jgi:hypothetical protein
VSTASRQAGKVGRTLKPANKSKNHDNSITTLPLARNGLNPRQQKEAIATVMPLPLATSLKKALVSVHRKGTSHSRMRGGCLSSCSCRGYDMAFYYSLLDCETDTHPKRVESDWATFCTEVLGHPEPRGEWPLYEYLSQAESKDKDQRARAKAQKSGPAWCPATFGTHANARGSLRHDENVLALYAFVADIDNKAEQPITIPEIQAGVSKSWGRGLRSMTRGDILLGD